MYKFDLEDTKLRVEFPKPGLTRHVSYTSSPRNRSVKQEEEWRWVRKLGNGSFGEVWLEEQVKGSLLGRHRAVKMISKRDNSSVIDYRRELEAIAKFSKPKYAHCFVTSHGWYDYNDHIFITMEYLEKGDLQKYLTKPFPESEAKEIASQIAEGLYFMHRNQYAHRDLKPANILVQQREPTWWVKIGDFGISKRAPEGMTDFRTGVFTPNYMAPEIRYPDPKLPRGADGYSYTFAVDMWALGEICVRLATHDAAFPTDTDLVHFLFMNGPFPPDKILSEKNASSECQDFVRKLLVHDHKARLTSEDAINHPWINVLRPPSLTNIGTKDVGNGPVPQFFGPGPRGMIPETGAETAETGTAASAQWPTEFDQESTVEFPLRANKPRPVTGKDMLYKYDGDGSLTAASAQWPGTISDITTRPPLGALHSTQQQTASDPIDSSAQIASANGLGIVADSKSSPRQAELLPRKWNETKALHVGKPSQPEDDTASKVLVTESMRLSYPTISHDQWDVLQSFAQKSPAINKLLAEVATRPPKAPDEDDLQKKKGVMKKKYNTMRLAAVASHLQNPESLSPLTAHELARNTSNSPSNAGPSNSLPGPSQKHQPVTGPSSTPPIRALGLIDAFFRLRGEQSTKRQPPAGSEKKQYSSAEFSKRRAQLMKEEANVLRDPLSDDEDAIVIDKYTL